MSGVQGRRSSAGPVRDKTQRDKLFICSYLYNCVEHTSYTRTQGTRGKMSCRFLGRLVCIRKKKILFELVCRVAVAAVVGTVIAKLLLTLPLVQLLLVISFPAGWLLSISPSHSPFPFLSSIAAIMPKEAAVSTPYYRLNVCSQRLSVARIC